MMQKARIEQLFRSHYRDMYRLAMILLHDDAESKDAVSEVFAQLTTREDDLEAGKERAFLMTGVRNRCLNVIRNRNIQQRARKLYLPEAENDIRSVEVMEEELAKINELIATVLTEQDRNILLLHYRSKLKYREIARQEGISEVAVYKHLRKAIETIRNHFKPNK
ncbi:sigma-70 family RNA polymerase sigma factor [Prevotella sp. A2931]|uniref:Sigma-70 family RNA polymerase sigma factor n=1 Tax=Prevotella illustrans TaxID=2800387 RepID=A0ABS3M532_9BACT|nr:MULTISPECIES: sigma-70 family RNA polymerase sigma factor [Prevotella]MBO1363274.1 sigma-70 family RNA polymerase sigma factor [Prevotella illustrans]PTL26584.1 RNA polymerase [Prevotella sp. oral taxon 820]